jgi:glycosyltransferase involved in cell wall biosynthesis
METRRLALSIVSPVYRAEGVVTELVRRITEAALQITESFEIVLVEDRGPDESWAKIVEVAQKNPRVRGARLSRNFGQHAAITAGLKLAGGDYVVLMDCDLQHDPAEIPRLWSKAQEGCDVVLARIEERKHAPHRNFGAEAFRIFNLLASGREQAETNLGSYSLLSRKVVMAFLQLPEKQRHYLHILRWMGFKVGYIDVKHQKRFEGQSSYTLRKLFRLALDGSVSQSRRLLHLSLGIGAAYVIVAFLMVIYILVRWALWGLKEGWPSIAVLILASTGCLMLAMGVLGLYIGAILEEVRARPLYIIDETTENPG